MAAKKKKKVAKVAPIPKGYSTVTASLIQADAAATIDFCKKAFGAKVLSKMAGPDGKLMHAELQIGDSRVMLSDAMMGDEPRATSLFLYVPDVDKAYAKAVKAGGTALMPPSDQFWGDRFGRLRDPQGNLWSMATHIEDVLPAEMRKRMKKMAKEMAAQQRETTPPPEEDSSEFDSDDDSDLDSDSDSESAHAESA